MWERLEMKVVQLTHGLAKRFAEMTRFPNDRDLKPRLLERLRGIIDRGKFRTCEWASIIVDGIEYRVNGKHTSHIFSQMEVLPDVKVVVVKFRGETLNDAAELGASYDAAMSSKNGNDINRAFASAHEDLKNLPSHTLNAAVMGMSFAELENSYTDRLPPDRAELMYEHVDFVVWVDGLFHGAGGDGQVDFKDTRHIQRGSLVAAMFATWQKNKTEAMKFWLLVRDGNSPNHRSADRTLRDWLLRTSIGLGKGAAKNEKQKASLREMYCRARTAWNAWRRGEPTSLRYYPDAPTPPLV